MEGTLLYAIVSKVFAEILISTISINPLYPTIRNSPFFDRNNSPNHKILRLAEEKPNLRKDSLTLEEFKKNKLHITDKFLNDLISEPCPLPKTQIIEVISFFIRNSTLINKLENSYNWKNEEDILIYSF